MIGGGGKEGYNPCGDKGSNYRIFIRNGFLEGIVPPAEFLEIPLLDEGSHVLAAKPGGTQGRSGKHRPPGLKELFYPLDP
jgi:hypothetical protein